MTRFILHPYNSRDMIAGPSSADRVLAKQKNKVHARQTRLRKKASLLGIQDRLKSLKQEVSASLVRFNMEWFAIVSLGA